MSMFSQSDTSQPQQDFEQRIAALSPEKREFLMQKMRKQDQHTILDFPVIRQHCNVTPLSFGQEQLWFLEQLYPGAPIYNRPLVLRFKGLLDIKALHQSLYKIVQRHQSLQTSFTGQSDRVQQVIVPVLSIDLPIIDLSSPIAEDREMLALSLATDIIRQPLKLDSAPLLRLALLRLKQEDHLLVLSLHHLISDGWSDHVLIKELAALYSAPSEQRSSLLPDLTIHYTDYTLWQRQVFQGQMLDKALIHWKHLFALPISPLELPTDHPRASLQTFSGASLSFTLSPELSHTLRTFCIGQKVTPSMALLATFFTLLYGYSQQTDLCISTPVTGRGRTELEPLIGFFVNTLLLRIQLQKAESFQALLQRVRTSTLEALEHQYVPLEKVMDILPSTQKQGRLTLARAGFAFQGNNNLSSTTFPHLETTQVHLHSGTAKTDLTLYLWDEQACIEGAFEYNNDLFEAATIEHWIEDFHHMVETAITIPQISVGALVYSHGLRSSRPEAFLDLYKISNLTKNQLLIWIGQKLQPGIPLYTIAGTFIFYMAIDPPRFQQAFTTLVDSSDALRTVMRDQSGVPFQVIVPHIPNCMSYLDLSEHADPAAEARILLKQRSQTPFDLTQQAFDSLLIKLSDTHFLWYLSGHHIVFDGWSSFIILQQMAKLYAQINNEELPEQITLPEYQEYRVYERSLQDSPRYQKALMYWNKKLSHVLEPLTFYGKNSASCTAPIERVVIDLGTERTQQLRALASTLGSTSTTLNMSLFTVFLACLSTYLHRLTGHNVISIGAPFHNRKTKAFKNTIGLFMEVFPLHIVVQSNDTFASLISKARAELTETMLNSRYTITNPIHKKTYDIFLNYQVTGATDFLGSPFDVDWFHPGYGDDSLAIQIYDFQSGKNLILNFDFHTDVFLKNQHTQTIQHFINVLDTLLTDISRPVQTLTLRTPQEACLIAETNTNRRVFPQVQAIHQLIDAQANKAPDRIAVVYGENQLSYAQLTAKANQLAHTLQQRGINIENRVGIYLDRSLELIIAVLAVLKAGATYVPLDHAQAQERLAFMLADAQISIILTKEQFVPQLASLPTNFLCLDTERDQIEQQSTATPERLSEAANLAYITYTSGSTGTPKGCMITHESLFNIFHAWVEDFGLQTSVTCHLQMANFTFDVFNGDLIRALCSGGKLVLVSRELLIAPQQLYTLMWQQQVTHAEFVPFVLRLLLDYLDQTKLSLNFLHLIVTGSDNWLNADYTRLRHRCGEKTIVINTYGVTEATIDSTRYQGPIAEELVGQVPIGQPFANIQTHLLDQYLQPVPVGVAAELYIGGAGIGRGYLNRPDLTAERFTPDPFTQTPGSRLYKTGDIARYLTDGNLEFLGRADFQIKLRGMRIEIEEIEARLLQHPAVQNAVVIADEITLEDTRLVAYITATSNQIPDQLEIRAYLKQSLPEYMVPSIIMQISDFPVTINGKIDRNALHKQRATVQQSRPVLRPPETNIERLLVSIWEDLLQHKEIGLDGNFFDLGGHSLLMLRLQNKLHEAFQKKISIIELFQFSTINALATYFSDEETGKAGSSQQQIQEDGKKLQKGQRRLQQQFQQRKSFTQSERQA